MKALLGFATLLLANSASGAAIDAAAGCKNNPAVVAACFTIRGRISAYNGTPSLRIWPVGTKRLLGVVPAENEIVPSNIRGKVTFGQSVFANLEVCPFEPARPGSMQAVCVESATDISIRRYQ
ncbi:MAG TPA: hypothetical protein VMV97_04760 [Sulfuriferula sp.]|nr:hypothetical protein [Sulfuriferula sp.]